MGFFARFFKPKAAPVQDPMDCCDRDSDWYLSEEGKACFAEAASHAQEMVDYLNSNGVSACTIDAYNNGDYKSLNLFPCKYVYEYLKASYDFEDEEGDYRDAFNIVSVFLSGDAVDTSKKDPNKKIDLSFPACLDWDKSPVLKYLAGPAHAFFYLDGPMGPYLASEVVFTWVIRYIEQVAFDKDEDANEEAWLNNPAFFTRKNVYSHQIEFLDEGLLHDKIKKAAKYPELVRDM